MPSENRSDRKNCLHRVDVNSVLVFAQCLSGVFLARFDRFVASHVFAHHDLIDHPDAEAFRVLGAEEEGLDGLPALKIAVGSDPDEDGPLELRAVIAPHEGSGHGVGFGAGSDLHGLLPSELLVVVDGRRPEFGDLHDRFQISDVQHGLRVLAPNADGPGTDGNPAVVVVASSFAFVAVTAAAAVADPDASEVDLHPREVQVATQMVPSEPRRNFGHRLDQLEESEQVQADDGQSQQNGAFRALLGPLQIAVGANDVGGKETR
mmetsp:Transcript_17163/g.39636  ORF Transcript_17163/g.39636 Transcript_17163/m.39636 type:complete len:263 (+) Transcript_17163:1025-1813(+)